ncbi:MAG: hypothetical protein Q8K36_01420, partial [Alphaproteobacteria bacterium]|nr:hypothetical protein [Alphaproteobacteria bacterium]
IGCIRTQALLPQFMLLAIGFQVMNYALVATMQPLLTRYIIYTEAFYVISIILLCHSIYPHIWRRS